MIIGGILLLVVLYVYWRLHKDHVNKMKAHILNLKYMDESNQRDRDYGTPPFLFPTRDLIKIKSWEYSERYRLTGIEMNEYSKSLKEYEDAHGFLLYCSRREMLHYQGMTSTKEVDDLIKPFICNIGCDLTLDQRSYKNHHAINL